MANKTKKLSDFGKRLRALGLTHDDFAQIVTGYSGKAISPAQVYQWATGFRNPSATAIGFLVLFQEHSALLKKNAVLEKQLQIMQLTPDQRSLLAKKLIEYAKEWGYITYQALNIILPRDRMSSEQIEDTIAALSEMGISIREEGDEQDEAVIAEILESLEESEDTTEEEKKTA